MDLLEYVIQQEQRGVNTLFKGNAENTQWIGNGNYLRIDYKDDDGKIIDTHPHVETVIKMLARSSLAVSHQQEILRDCAHESAVKYLKCMEHNDPLEKVIDTRDVKNE